MQRPTLLTKKQSKQGTKLLVGVLGIYACYWSAGYLQQKILKAPYQPNQPIHEYALFESPISLIWIQAAVSWFIGYLINRRFYQPSTQLPTKKILICSILVTVSALSSILAIKIASFPVVMMIKSCSIIPVVFVGIFCSRVKDDSLKLGVQKIIIAITISIGILVYNFGANRQSSQQSTSLLGVALMLISITSDGFLPDIQAVIKCQYNPRPTEMFSETNKWVAVISLLYAGATGSISYLISFSLNYGELLRDLLFLSIFSAIGQIFVYRMVKEFKQHIVPFVITTRKIFTVVISIFVYKHETSGMQVVGIAIVFISAIYEYCAQIFWNNTGSSSQHKLQYTIVSQTIKNELKSENCQDQKTPSSKQRLEVAL